jgi:hypothetical protein
LEAAWREVERIALGNVAKQRAVRVVVVAAPRRGDDAAIATAEQGSRARQSMLWRWQRRAMSPLSTPDAARLALQNNSDVCPTNLSTGDRHQSATARCHFSLTHSGSATEMTEAYRAICPEEYHHVAL